MSATRTAPRPLVQHTSPRAAATRSSLASDWITSTLMLLGVGVAAAGLNSIIAELSWWFVMMMVAMLVFAAAAIVRSFAARRSWPSAAAILTAFSIVTVIFAPAQSLLAVIPTPATFERLGELGRAGADSVSTQGIPANADVGILYLLCVGVSVIAVVMDALAFAVRAPAFTGVPLAVLLLVPSIVRSDLDNGFFFALTAAVWIAILLVRSRRSGKRMAVGIAAAAITAGLVVPLALPAVDATAGSAGGTVSGFSTGINPIITLGDDLRRNDPAVALRYTTTDPDGQYLRLTALDDFSGRSWSGSNTTTDFGNDVAAIAAAPGLGADVPVTSVTTEITVSNILSKWLPTPYAPTSVTGLVGAWTWDPEALTVRTERSSARGQVYTVESTRIAPSVDQLIAAGTTVEPGFERYLKIPVDLPPLVSSTALEVTAGAANNYERAIALQAYFRGGEFTYSEDSPVENGYDGSGASVLGAFLTVKYGYCVQFASAMASMARVLGIPARIAVGFTPGQGEAQDDGTTLYTVTTFNLHSWPELYFAGIGWVRFEPTPGRGFEPEFAPLAVDDPATPNVDESVPPPNPTAAPTGAPDRPVQDTPNLSDPQAVAPGSTAAPAPWWTMLFVLLAVLVLAPAIVRSVRRSRRLDRVAAGSAAAAWEELRDTADDLGLKTDSGRTPRQLSDDLQQHLSSSGAQALARVRGALESEAFAGHGGGPDPADVRAVIRSLRRSAGIRASLMARLAPRSLVARWLPEPARP